VATDPESFYITALDGPQLGAGVSVIDTDTLRQRFTSTIRARHYDHDLPHFISVGVLGHAGPSHRRRNDPAGGLLDLQNAGADLSYLQTHTIEIGLSDYTMELNFNPDLEGFYAFL